MSRRPTHLRTHYRGWLLLLLNASMLFALLPAAHVWAAGAGSLDLSFDPGSGADDIVSALAVQPDGKVLLGGWFRSVHGTAHSGIARLNADGSLDSSFNSDVDRNVYALAVQGDGKVLLGGYFDNVNGTARANIARVNADGSLDTTFDPGSGTDDAVFGLAVQPDGKVLLGGHFFHVNGTLHGGIARLNTDGSLDTTFDPGSAADGDVDALALQPDGEVLLGGDFNNVNGTARNYIARVHADGSLDAAFDPNANRTVYALAVQGDGKVLLGGFFSSVHGTARNHIARVHADGSLDATFDPGSGTDGSVSALAVQPDGKVLLGGGFTSVNGTARANIARMSADGSLDATFDPGGGADSDVYALAVQPDAKVLLGGYFTNVHGTPRARIARLNGDQVLAFAAPSGSVNEGAGSATIALHRSGAGAASARVDISGGTASAADYRFAPGALDTTFDPGSDANSNVLALAVQPDGKVLLGGIFSSVHGTARARIARLNADGSLDATFDPGSGADGIVYALAVQSDGKVLLGGSFTTLNGTTRGRIARLNADGSLDATFDPGTGVDQPVYALALQGDGKVLLGGTFSEVNGTVRAGIARLNADGSLDTAFDPGSGVDQPVVALAVQSDGKVLLGGLFTTVNNTPHANIARLKADGSLDATFDPGSDANVAVGALAVQGDGKVLLAGDFTSVHGTARANIARVNADGSLDTSFDPGSGVIGVVDALAVQGDGKVLLGGLFTSVNGIARPNIARVNGDGSLDTSFDPGSGTNGSMSALALQGDGKILLGGNFTSVHDTPRAGVARLNGDLLVTWADGDTADKTITLPIVDDTLVEGAETVQLALTPVNGTIAGTPANYTLTIVDNDAAPNTAPTITSIADQQILGNTATAALGFTVGDAESAPDSLEVTASTSNLTLVPTAALVLGGSGASRTVTVTPAANQTGTATITLTVSDGSLTSSTTFTLTVATFNVYLPLIQSSLVPTTTVTSTPLDAQVIPARVATPGEVFLIQQVTLPILPAGDYVLSASPDRVSPTLVDDELTILVDGQVVLQHLYIENRRSTPAIVPIPASVLAAISGRTITLQYRDVYGEVLQASPIYLFRLP